MFDTKVAESTNESSYSQNTKKINMNMLERLNKIRLSFSFVERGVFYTFVVLLIVGGIGIISVLNSYLLVTIPAPGGSIVEGVVGAPRFINPILALSDADRDLTALVYSGLLRATPEGTLIPDLAKNFTLSDDGLTYTFTLREDAVFHDGTPVTADDVMFTISLAQNPDTKSPKRANWEGVLVKTLDAQTVQFTLSQPYTPFLENATMGILPKHLWEDIPTEQVLFSTRNAEPIGSGPYSIVAIEKDRAGIPEEYTLERFVRYTLGSPYIKTIYMRFYPNEDELIRAFEKKNVENINSIEPEYAVTLDRNDISIHTTLLPRIFGVFFNQNEATIFTSSSIRTALNLAIDREKIVYEVLNGYGTPTNGPLPTRLAQSILDTDIFTNTTVEPDYEKAQTLLEDAGWNIDDSTGVRTKELDDVTTELRFSLATSNAPELKHTAELIKEEWGKIGVAVDLEFYETGTLNQEIIRPRKYDALLFGQIIGRDLDPFAFWHSSQQNDPGLNIALYANITADKALESIRTTTNPDDLVTLYYNFYQEIQSDVPAVFLYSPDLIYLTQNTLQGVVDGTVTTSAERFLNVHEWYIYTQKVWSFFQK